MPWVGTAGDLWSQGWGSALALIQKVKQQDTEQTGPFLIFHFPLAHPPEQRSTGFLDLA